MMLYACLPEERCLAVAGGRRVLHDQHADDGEVELHMLGELVGHPLHRRLCTTEYDFVLRSMTLYV
jgi:hypothetical protein